MYPGFADSFIRSSGFFSGTLRVFYVQDHVICKSYQFDLILSDSDGFISPSCLTAVAGASRAVLKTNNESRHPSPGSNLKGNTLSFCLLSVMLAVGLSYTAFITSRFDPFILTLLRVSVGVGFYQMLCLHLLINWYNLSSIFFQWFIILIDVKLLNHPCITGINLPDHNV